MILTNRPLVLTYILFVIILYSTLCFGKETNIINYNTNTSNEIYNIENGWQYRIGDSPKDANGHLIWLDDGIDSNKWISVENFDDIPNTGYNSLWIRTQLPDTKDSDPALFFPSVRQIVQVYLNDQQIYQFGDFTTNKDLFVGWHMMLVRLPDDYSKGILCFRIWSDKSTIGLNQPIWLAPADIILKKLFIKDIDEIIFAPLFIILGFVLLFIYLFVQRNNLLIGIATFLISIGIFTGSNSYFLQTMVYAPRLFFLLDFFSLMSSPIGGLYLTEQIITKKFKPVVRRFWKGHLFFLLLSILSMIIIKNRFTDLFYQLFFIITSTSATTNFILVIKSSTKGKREIKLLFIGLIIFYLFGGLELFLHYVINISSNIRLIHFGTLGFVICLTLIIIDRYIENNRQKEIAQKKVIESEKFKEIDKMKSRFFANISHEFRTPLTLILGTAQQILNESQDKNIRKRSRLQLKNGRRLLNLVNELLDLSRIESGRMELKVKKTDIWPLIKGVCQTFESHVVHHQISLIYETGLNAAYVWIDRDKIDKVLGNLLSNAVKFTPTGGEIKVSVSQNDSLEISISDTGPGIPDEHLEHIFDRFYQVENGYPQNQQGSGIGLALARELVLLHRGKISVSSEIDKGSTFTVHLPLGKDHFSEQDFAPVPSLNFKSTKQPPVDIHDKDDKPVPVRHSKKKDAPIILITEDHSELRAYIHEIIEDEYEILEAVDGKDGLLQAINCIPDLVISDVMMPNMDGYQFCEKLKTDERTSHIPVVLLTARSDSASKIEGLTLGADDYLTKPFEPDELKVRIKNLIDQRRKLRQRFNKQITTPLKDIAVMPADEVFLKRAADLIEMHLNNPDLSVDWLSSKMALSRSQLHRKIHALTNQTVVDFIHSIRLKHAIQMLESKTATISEIAYQTGFGSPDYFRRCFKKRFGKSPSQYTF